MPRAPSRRRPATRTRRCRSICDADETKLLKATQSELDPKKHLALLQNLLAVHQGNAPNLSLIETQDLMSYGARVRNFQNVNLKINYADVDLAE